MTKYIMRLDDACEKRDIEKWNRMEVLLDKYSVKPLVGIIPHCEDPMMDEYLTDENFWQRVQNWIDKGWTIAMHGYNHVYNTECGGLNPVNKRSEFAGNTLECQREKIAKGVAIMREHGIDPKVFFAPSHTFDENTIVALKKESNIYIISDTVAFAPYVKYGITFVPQQSGRVRKLPFDTVTFCYHPNTMKVADYEVLEMFLKVNGEAFAEFPMSYVTRKVGFFDWLIKKLYFMRR